MKNKNFKSTLAFLCFLSISQLMAQNKNIATEKVEMVQVEAEAFTKQTNDSLRKWHVLPEKNVTTAEVSAHKIETAGNNSFIQILPDTRKTHKDKMFKGTNFSDEPGKLAVISYPIKFKNSGRYYVWVKAYSEGSEDNGVHVGINGTWPTSGQKIQWCEGKNVWTWASKQRTEKNHCGEQGKIYLDVLKPGTHDIQFSMREDGFAMDQFILTTDSTFRPAGFNTASVKPVKKEKEQTFVIKATEIALTGSNFYVDKANDCLAINPSSHKEAVITHTFGKEDGSYNVIFKGIGENDGSSAFKIWINDRKIIDYATPLSKQTFEVHPKFFATANSVEIKKGDIIKVEAKIGSADGKEYSRGRWKGIEFTNTNSK